MECLTERWIHISSHCKIPKKEFLEAVRLILDSTFFIFDNQCYKQNFGTPMDSPLSPVIADIVMQNLENSVLRTTDFHFPIYYRYVDDILMAVPKNKINWILNTFNNFHTRLQFMLEVGGERINFLDTTIILHNNKIRLVPQTNRLREIFKLLFSAPYFSKRGTILSLVDRVFLLSHSDFHEKNFKFVISTLLNNDYPLKFIFRVINDRIKSLIHTKTNKQKKYLQKITIHRFQNGFLYHIFSIP